MTHHVLKLEHRMCNEHNVWGDSW